MKRSHGSKIMFLAAVGCIVYAVPAQADIFMKQKIHASSTRMGRAQPETNGTQVVWLGASKARLDGSDGESLLVLSEMKMMYILNHKEKQYIEMPLVVDRLFERALSAPPAKDPKRAEAMANRRRLMREGMEGGSAKVTETGETKRIGKWGCRKYLVEENSGLMGERHSEIWATQDIKIDYGLYYASRLGVPGGGIFGQGTRPPSAAIVNEMKKVKGVIVYQTTTTTRRNFEETATSELLECSEKAAPAGTYDLPPGYKQVSGVLK